MAKAKKTPSGAWRTLVYSHTEIIDGKEKKIYESFTAETKAESEYQAAQFAVNKNKRKDKKPDITVGEAADIYLQAKQNILAASTIHGYEVARKHSFAELFNEKISDLTQEKLQKYVNDESKKKSKYNKLVSPKTVANRYGLISSALSMQGVNFNITLPKIPEKVIILPDVREIIEIVKGESIELPCLLAMWMSFTISEIRGIKCSDIKNGAIVLNTVKVKVGGEDVVKETGKTGTRLRMVSLPKYIYDLIEHEPTYQHYKETGEDNYLVTLTYGQIKHRFSKLVNNRMTFHQLRHMSASIMLLLNIPEKYAMERGGWKTPQIMKKVYQHTMTEEKINVDNRINDFFDELL